jgi:hypothetical protein
MRAAAALQRRRAQRALLIKGALLFKPNTIVTSVPFHLER